MIYCRKCGAELEENAKFCPNCGTPVAVPIVERAEPVGRARRPLSPLAIAGIAVLAIVVVVALIAIPLLLGGLLPFSRVVGSGNVVTQEKTFSNFTSVEVGSGFKVQITQGISYRIVITADDNVINYVQVTETGTTLVIRLQPLISFQTSTLRAEITMPDLQALQFSGGVTGTAARFASSHNFRVELSGGSTLEMNGRANNLTAISSGGSSLDLSDFPVNNADVVFSGGSQGTVNVNGRLDADLSGGSRLFYIGNPTFGDISTSGGSTISRA